MRILTVQPLAPGWSLSLAGVEDVVFRSGAEAEAAARRLGERLSELGDPVKLIVRLRDGSVGGRFLFPASVPEICAMRDAA